jgi:hypothetical protein
VSGSIPRTFIGNDVAFDAGWGEAFDLVAAAARRTSSTDSGMPVLRAVQTTPPAVWCGIPQPQETSGRSAVRFQIDPTASADDGCPLTVDLYRTDDGIDTIVVYKPEEPGAG